MHKNENEILIEYIRKLLYNSNHAEINPDTFSDDNKSLAAALDYLGHCIKESRHIANALAKGDIDSDYEVYENPLAAPLKSIQGNLRNLAWTANRVASGDYDQKVLRMGSLTDAFNQMSNKLKNHTSEMEAQINTDYLTGIGNRRHYNQIASSLVEKKQFFSIAFIDMDGMKYCNDKYGHAEGDQYILSVCELLISLCQDHEYAFRLGGDEFLFLSEISTKDELEKRIELARDEYSKKYASISEYIHDFSYGCAEMNYNKINTLSNLLSIADQRMYNSKTLHYLHRKQNSKQNSLLSLDNTNLNELDKTGLDDRMFEVFSSTAQNRYLYICNMETGVSRWNLQAVHDFGLPGEYFFDAKNLWTNYIHPDDQGIYIKDINAVFNGQKQFHDVHYRARMKDGNYVMCSCMGALLKGTGDEPDLFAGTLTNHGIVDNVDPITNLYNIYEFSKYLSRMKTEHQSAHILCIGINQFSEINTVYGYITGNQILQKFALKLQDLIRGNGRLFRLDGVKFSMILEQSSPEIIDELYKKITDIGRCGIQLNNLCITFEISGAFLQFNETKVDANTIYTELLHAVSISKKEHLGKLVIYNSIQDGAVREEMILMDVIRQDVLNGCRGFYLMYQPQVDINGKIIGAEALLRWSNDDYGVVPPGLYIPLLENDSCFYTLGLWIMKTALREAKVFLENDPDFHISINISYRQIEHYGFRDDVVKLLRQENFPAKNLTLELTEHCRSLNPQILEQDILFFKSLGIRIAADDFGTGYSTFRLMRQLSFDYIKIDRSFITHILEEYEDQIMLESIISCAQKLGMMVCIEGVETETVLEFIKQYRAEYYQGYLFAKPLSLSDMKKFLIENV